LSLNILQVCFAFLEIYVTLHKSLKPARSLRCCFCHRRGAFDIFAGFARRHRPVLPAARRVYRGCTGTLARIGFRYRPGVHRLSHRTARHYARRHRPSTGRPIHSPASPAFHRATKFGYKREGGRGGTLIFFSSSSLCSPTSMATAPLCSSKF
jgi:hypothetical protein